MNWWLLKMLHRAMCKKTSVNLYVVIFKWGMEKMAGNNSKRTEQIWPKEGKRETKKKCQRIRIMRMYPSLTRKSSFCFSHLPPSYFSFIQLFSKFSSFLFVCIQFLVIIWQHPLTKSLTPKPSYRKCEGIFAFPAYVFYSLIEVSDQFKISVSDD